MQDNSKLEKIYEEMLKPKEPKQEKAPQPKPEETPKQEPKKPAYWWNGFSWN